MFHVESCFDLCSHVVSVPFSIVIASLKIKKCRAEYFLGICLYTLHTLLSIIFRSHFMSGRGCGL